MKIKFSGDSKGRKIRYPAEGDHRENDYFVTFTGPYIFSSLRFSYENRIIHNKWEKVPLLQLQ